MTTTPHPAGSAECDTRKDRTLHRDPLSMTTEEQAQQLDADAARQTRYGAAEARKAANLARNSTDPATVRAFLASAVEYVRQANRVRAEGAAQ